MEKLKNIIKNNKFVLLTPIVATILFIIIFIIKSIIPIGKNTLLAVDFYHQYGPLLSEFYDRVKSGASLIYSYQTGMGLPYFRNFFNYLSSPFNVLLFLFRRDDIVTAFSFIISLKIITASTTMAYALKKFFKKDGLLITVFGLSYAFSTYFVAFYWNIMWLDGLIYLPLITLGIKKLIDENKQNLYIISLAIAIISNYFIGYMLCIYSALFFLVYLIFNTKITRKELLKKIGLFTLSSIISGGLVAFMLIPYITSLSTISATGDKFVFAKNFYFNPIYFLANHYSDVKTIVFSSQDYFLPNVSSGILVFALVLLYFFNKEIKLKHKITALVLILSLFISFIYLPLDFIWHGFHTPNDLPFRYSFIYIFILNGIAFYSALHLNKIKILIPIIITAVLYLFGIYLFKVGFLSYDAFMINMIFITSNLIAILFFIQNYQLFGKILCLFLTILNIILNINLNWNIDHDKNTFMDNYVQINYTVNQIKDRDKDFYRIEKATNQTLNDGAWYNYNGISIFSSVAYEKMTKTQKRLGLPSNNVNSYYYRTNTPIYNSIMSIKYLISQTRQTGFYEYQDEINYNRIYKNNYFLPIAFATNKELKEWKADYNNPFINQDEYVNKATGEENIFEKIDIFKLNEEDEFEVNERQVQYLKNEAKTAYLKTTTTRDGNVYIYVYNYYLEHFVVNGEYHFITKNEPYILDIGYYDKDSEIFIELPLTKDTQYIDLYAYQINEEKFENFYNKLKEESIDIKSFKEEEIEGYITASENKIVFTSIPYDEGFEVYVDDKKVEKYPIANAFLSFDITEGKHKIKITYKIPKLKTGIIVSFISLISFIILNILKKKKSH